MAKAKNRECSGQTILRQQSQKVAPGRVHSARFGATAQGRLLHAEEGNKWGAASCLPGKLENFRFPGNKSDRPIYELIAGEGDAG